MDNESSSVKSGITLGTFAAILGAGGSLHGVYQTNKANNLLEETRGRLTKLAPQNACLNASEVFYPSKLGDLSESAMQDKAKVHAALGDTTADTFNICTPVTNKDGSREIVVKKFHIGNEQEMSDAYNIIKSAEAAKKAAPALPAH